MNKNWIALLGVIVANNYDEFNKAYSAIKNGKRGAEKSSFRLWETINGNGDLSSFYKKKGKKHDRTTV